MFSKCGLADAQYSYTHFCIFTKHKHNGDPSCKLCEHSLVPDLNRLVHYDGIKPLDLVTSESVEILYSL